MDQIKYGFYGRRKYQNHNQTWQYTLPQKWWKTFQMLLYLPPTVGLPGMPFIFFYIYKEFELLIFMESPACVFYVKQIT